MTARTEEYARLAAQGMTCTEIAVTCGVSVPAVSMWAKRHGVKLPDHRLSPAHAARISRLARARHADPAFNPLAALTPEQVAARFDAISDRAGEIVPDMGAAQGMIELTKAQKAHFADGGLFDQIYQPGRK